MIKLLKIKWETIISILVGLVTIISWSLYESGCDFKDWRMLVITLISTVLFIVTIIGYQDIKKFRHDVLKMWK